jgi:hypothetical protein
MGKIFGLLKWACPLLQRDPMLNLVRGPHGQNAQHARPSEQRPRYAPRPRPTPSSSLPNQAAPTVDTALTELPRASRCLTLSPYSPNAKQGSIYFPCRSLPHISQSAFACRVSPHQQPPPSHATTLRYRAAASDALPP